MPDGSRAGGPYPAPPSHDDEGILAAIRNNRPEDIPGLAWTRPDFSASGHKIIRTFAIDGKKRPDRQYIRCAICSGDHPKFLDGAVLWSPDAWLRVIGHVCAAKPEHFGEAGYRTLRRQKEQEERDNVAFNWLEANIALLPAAAASLAELKTFALFYEEQQRAFFRGVKDLAEQLETSVQRYGGALTVEQELSGARIVAAEIGIRAAAQTQFEQITIGNLEGQAFLRRPRRKRSQQLDGAMQALARIPEGEGDTPMLALIDRGGEHEVTITAIAALRALQNAAKLAYEFSDAPQFFSPENLSTLEEWGRDARNPMRFTIKRTGVRACFVLEDRSQVTLPMTWPMRPDLAALRRIVDAGIELEGLLKRQGHATDPGGLSAQAPGAA